MRNQSLESWNCLRMRCMGHEWNYIRNHVHEMTHGSLCEKSKSQIAVSIFTNAHKGV